MTDDFIPLLITQNGQNETENSFFVFLLVCSSCALDKRDIISSNFDFADIQLKHAFVEMDSVYKSTDKLLANPRNIDPNGFLRMVASHDWTSGFSQANFGICMNILKMIFGRRRPGNRLNCLNRRNGMGVPTIWALKCIVAMVTVIG